MDPTRSTVALSPSNGSSICWRCWPVHSARGLMSRRRCLALEGESGRRGCWSCFGGSLAASDGFRAIWLGARLIEIRVVPPRLRVPVGDHIEHFSAGLLTLQRHRDVAAVVCCSLVAAFLIAVSAWLTLLAFGLPVSFVSGFVILGLITIGGMIPTPGALGGFHAVCQFGLIALLKVDPASTVAPVIALHAVLYVPAAALGALFFLWQPANGVYQTAN